MLKIKEILGEEIAEMNNSNLMDLKNRVIDDQVTWILGAGISKSLGIPLWKECLMKMWARILMLDKVKAVDGRGSEFYKALENLKVEIKDPEMFLGKVNKEINGKEFSEILNGVNTLEAAEYIQNFIAEEIGEEAACDPESLEAVYASLVKDALTPIDKPEEIQKRLKNQVVGLLASYFVKCGQK